MIRRDDLPGGAPVVPDPPVLPDAPV